MEQFTVVQCGSERWPRFVVRDSFDRFWTGEDWGGESEALVFDQQYDAYKLALEFTLGKKLRHFATTVNLFVEGDEPITVEQLRRFLEANCFIGVGNDESDETFERLSLDVDVAWDDLEEVE